MNGLLEVGDRIVDNDPRMRGRTLKVVSIVGDHANAQNEASGRVYRIQVKRIFTDAAKRRSGFNRIDGAA